MAPVILGFYCLFSNVVPTIFNLPALAVLNEDGQIDSSSQQRRQEVPSTVGNITTDVTSTRIILRETRKEDVVSTQDNASPLMSTPLVQQELSTTSIFSTHERPPVLFLGLFFKGWFHVWRLSQRTTFLSYYYQHHTSTPNRICTLKQYLKTQAIDCDIVYVFILEGKKWLTKEHASILEMERADTLMLDPKKYPTRTNVPTCTRWYQSVVDTINDDHPYLIGHTEILHSMFCPEELWDGLVPLRDNPQYSIAQIEDINKRKRNYQTVFTAFTSDVVKGPLQDALSPDSDDNITWSLAEEVLPSNITKISLKGCTYVARETKMKVKVRGKMIQWSKALIKWDQYKDAKLEASGGYDINPVVRDEIENSVPYQNSLGGRQDQEATSSKRPRMLLGIFSMDSPQGSIRRQVIRNTYLRYYRNTTSPNRIFSLSDLLSTPQLVDKCQLAYAFVLGSNPNGTTSLLEPNPSPLLVERRYIPQHLVNETDLLHLNIQENMEDGKTPTWIRYATNVSLDRFYFDYLAKTDTDTLLLPDIFLDKFLIETRCPSFPKNVRVFGGLPMINQQNFPNINVGPMYSVGSFIG